MTNRISKIKNCKNCKKDFIIEQDDFGFYEKMSVPVPEKCPQCRQQLRTLFRNFKTLYRRPSSMSGKMIISVYDTETLFPVYDISEWWGDNWDPMSYGIDIDWNQTFFDQIIKLFNTVPHISIVNVQCENCEYSNQVLESKNCYLAFGCVEAEDCDYGHIVWNSRDSTDNLYLFKCESCYECIDCLGSTKLFYSQECESCVDSIGLFDCRNCLNCIGCVGQINKSYCIFNKQYSKEKYLKIFPKLIKLMKKNNEWGSFLPIELSSFTYNEAIVNEYMPLSKEEALSKGFKWKDNIPSTKGQGTIEYKDVPKSSDDYSDKLLTEILTCEKCAKNYKLINREINFYKKNKLSLPDKCFNCRHEARMSKKNPRDLSEGICTKCGNVMLTSYKKEDQKIYKIYCEKCYQQEIY